VNIKDPVPFIIMDYEGGGVKCDFGTLQSCDIASSPSVTECVNFNFTTM
jgi:hypothetical protein